MHEFKTYDLKLKDGRFFSNIVISDWSGACYSIGEILNNYYYRDVDNKREDLEMSAWDSGDENCVAELCSFYSDDIEYIAEAYKNKN